MNNEIRIYGEWKPEIVTLHGIALDGSALSVKACRNPDLNRFEICGNESDVKQFTRLHSTHHKCNNCDNLIQDYMFLCTSCKATQEHKIYLSLPIIKFDYPCFVNDEYMSDSAVLEDYLLENEIEDYSTYLGYRRIYNDKEGIENENNNLSM